MSDLRFAPDTLFLVAEEDWRLWRDDCGRGVGAQPKLLPEERQGELSAPSSSAQCFQPAPKAAFGPADATLRPRREKPETRGGGPRGWGRGKKASAKEVEETSAELCDILHMVNEAHRLGKGDLVWLSYDVSQNAKWTPCHGSTLIAVSAHGARILHNNFSKWFQKPDHFDLCLKCKLQELSATNDMPSCYVFPSVGGYDDHVSAFLNTKTPQVRQCSWEAYGAKQEGMRECNADGRAFSRAVPWKPYMLKAWPRVQKDPWLNDVTLKVLDTLPLETPDIWWTAAASVSKDFYKKAVHKHVPVAAGGPGQAPPSFQPGQKRAHSPTRQ